MSDIHQAQTALVSRILKGSGQAPAAQRLSAFHNLGLDGPLAKLVEKVAGHAFTVTTEDFSAVKATGESEDQLFELVVCAAVGQAMRQHQAALSALAVATGKG